MASEVLERLLYKSLEKEELKEIGLFRRGKDIESHLHMVESKMEELRTKEDEKASFLFKTLAPEVETEVKCRLDYGDNKKSYQWLTTTLCRLYKLKEAKVSKLIDFLGIRQRNMKLMDFVSEIRAKGWQLMGENDPEKREEYMLMSFINGLDSKECSLAVQQLNPKSLDEAVELVKYEQNNTNYKAEVAGEQVLVMDHTVELTKQVRSMHKEIEALKSKVDHLTELLLDGKIKTPANHEKRQSFRPRFSAANNTRLQGVTCYNCNKKGHIAVNCPAPIVCKLCQKVGHRATNCRSKGRDRLRQIECDQLSEVCTEDILSFEDNPDSSQPEDTQIAMITSMENDGNPIEEGESNIAVINSAPQTNKRNFQIKEANLKRRCIRYPEEVLAWDEYITGKGKKPRTNPETVISKSKNETARNKPVVSCSVEGRMKNVFFDTGSQSNVVDSSYLGFLRKVNPSIKFLPSSGSLSCANGTQISVLGHTVLTVKIGTKICPMKFIVVDAIFPNVIVGLKQMKRDEISVVAAWDCIKIKQESLPFVSKTQPASMLSVN